MAKFYAVRKGLNTGIYTNPKRTLQAPALLF